MTFRTIADLMAISTRTAPEAAGRDFITIEGIEGLELRQLGEAMIAYGERTGKANFDCPPLESRSTSIVDQ
jgi:uncharacterized ferredoxin-like protein